jgi:hypothetical protein
MAAGKYQPLCDGSSMVTTCPISRVFASLQPGSCSSSSGSSSGASSKADAAAGYFDRQAAAQLANVHSSLVLAVHDVLEQADSAALQLPCCVLELVQQERHVDFTTAVNILQEVAQVGADCRVQHS